MELSRNALWQLRAWRLSPHGCGWLRCWQASLAIHMAAALLTAHSTPTFITVATRGCLSVRFLPPASSLLAALCVTARPGLLLHRRASPPIGVLVNA
jgi:hypothetical protein